MARLCAGSSAGQAGHWHGPARQVSTSVAAVFHIEKPCFRIVKSTDVAVQQKIPPLKISFRIMEYRS
jgi:hypothetical protein